MIVNNRDRVVQFLVTLIAFLVGGYILWLYQARGEEPLKAFILAGGMSGIAGLLLTCMVDYVRFEIFQEK